MALEVAHTTVVVGADDPTKEINKDEWNGTAAHTLSGFASIAQGGTGASSLSAGTLPVINSGGTAFIDSLLTYDAAYTGPLGVGEAHPSFIYTGAGFSGSYTRTSNTGNLRISDWVTDINPSTNQAAGVSNTYLKFLHRITSTATKNVGTMTGLDMIVKNAASGITIGGAMTGASMIVSDDGGSTFTSGMLGYVTGVGPTHASSSTGSDCVAYAAFNGTAHVGNLAGTIGGNYYAFEVINWDCPAALSVTGNRAGLYLGTMSTAGTVTGKDRAILSDATQASEFVGSIGIGTAGAPTTKLDVLQSSSFGSFTGTLGAAADAVGYFRSAPTSPSTNTFLAPLSSDNQVTLTSNPASAWVPLGAILGVTITSSDTAVYPSGSVAEGVIGAAQYNGTGSIPSVIAISASAGRNNTGGVGTAMVCYDANSIQGTSATSGTVAQLTYWRGNRPTGRAGMTYANITCLHVPDMMPSNTPTMTNPPVGINIANQTGTGAFALKQVGTTAANNLIFWGSKFSTYANISLEGHGVPAIYKSGLTSTINTATTTTIASYTPPATAGRYRVQGGFSTDSNTNNGTAKLTVDYVDAQGTTHTADIISMEDAAGAKAATTTVAASKEYHGGPWIITINNSATAIVLKMVTTATISGIAWGSIEQIA